MFRAKGGTRKAVHPLEKRRRALRRACTDAEAVLWRCLRDRQVGGVKFRRQHEYGPFILDFYCHEFRLGVELDGAGHNEPAQSERDCLRDRVLASAGIRVLRFTNQAVLERREQVLTVVAHALAGARR